MIMITDKLRKKNLFFKNSIDDSFEKGQISSTDRGEKGEIS